MSKTRFAFPAVFALLAILPPASAAGERVLASEVPPPAWKQGIHYRMEARLEEDREVLSARGQVRYQNESPDTLTEFYFHLYLNAFRPNSAWARHDLERGIRTFQDLGPEEHGFERVEGMRVDGSPASVSYPYAPDSTILRVELPRALPPGGAITLDFDWEARPSSIPRRQGRRGRHYDFAQWYPRVVAYDLEGWADHPLYRAGEFYGDFATYDVTFDASDSTGGAGSIVAYDWDFGDGGTATGTPVTHTFEPERTDEFTVTLFVWNSEGQFDTEQIQVIAIVPGDVTGDDEPVAEFVVSDPLMIFESENRPNTPSLFQVSFDPRGSFADAGHQIEYYLWEFGDGSFHIEESDLEVTHIYELAAMTKTVVARLTVFDDQGLEGTKTANITLTDPAGPGDIDEE